MSIVRLESVTKEFTSQNQRNFAVRDISLAISPGEMVLLLGPSGSGKTTLLTLMAGLIKPTCGEVVLFDRNIEEYSPRMLQRLRAERLGFVFQNFLLIDTLTVLENIALVVQFAGRSRKEAHHRAHELLEQLHILHLAHNVPTELSQGEKQRVAVARAIVNHPDLIIADEPTASLESKQGFEIIDLLHQYADEYNKSVICASHDLRIVEYADRVLEMQDGSVVKSEIIHEPFTTL